MLQSLKKNSVPVPSVFDINQPIHITDMELSKDEQTSAWLRDFDRQITTEKKVTLTINEVTYPMDQFCSKIDSYAPNAPKELRKEIKDNYDQIKNSFNKLNSDKKEILANTFLTNFTKIITIMGAKKPLTKKTTQNQQLTYAQNEVKQLFLACQQAVIGEIIRKLSIPLGFIVPFGTEDSAFNINFDQQLVTVTHDPKNYTTENEKYAYTLYEGTDVSQFLLLKLIVSKQLQFTATSPPSVNNPPPTTPKKGKPTNANTNKKKSITPISSPITADKENIADITRIILLEDTAKIMDAFQKLAQSLSTQLLFKKDDIITTMIMATLNKVAQVIHNTTQLPSYILDFGTADLKANDREYRAPTLTGIDNEKKATKIPLESDGQYIPCVPLDPTKSYATFSVAPIEENTFSINLRKMQLTSTTPSKDQCEYLKNMRFKHPEKYEQHLLKSFSIRRALLHQQRVIEKNRQYLQNTVSKQEIPYINPTIQRKFQLLTDLRERVLQPYIDKLKISPQPNIVEILSTNILRIQTDYIQQIIWHNLLKEILAQTTPSQPLPLPNAVEILENLEKEKIGNQNIFAPHISNDLSDIYQITINILSLLSFPEFDLIAIKKTNNKIEKEIHNKIDKKNILPTVEIDLLQEPKITVPMTDDNNNKNCITTDLKQPSKIQQVDKITINLKQPSKTRQDNMLKLAKLKLEILDYILQKPQPHTLFLIPMSATPSAAQLQAAKILLLHLKGITEEYFTSKDDYVVCKTLKMKDALLTKGGFPPRSDPYAGEALGSLLEKCIKMINKMRDPKEISKEQDDLSLRIIENMF
jgi:hypothetical protein